VTQSHYQTDSLGQTIHKTWLTALIAEGGGCDRVEASGGLRAIRPVSKSPISTHAGRAYDTKAECVRQSSSEASVAAHSKKSRWPEILNWRPNLADACELEPATRNEKTIAVAISINDSISPGQSRTQKCFTAHVYRNYYRRLARVQARPAKEAKPPVTFSVHMSRRTKAARVL